MGFHTKTAWKTVERQSLAEYS